jgi:alpha-tubulin suppressor-like RCC1 family protein
MGTFSDLGFKKRDGKIVSPDSELFAGRTLQEVKDYIMPSGVGLTSLLDSDGIIEIDGDVISNGSSYTVTQEIDEDNWSRYEITSYGSDAELTVNGNTMTVSSESTDTKKIKKYAADYYGAIALLDDGSVYSRGRNNYSSLGNTANSTTLTTWTLSDMFTNVKDIARGHNNNTFVVDNNGRLFVIGDGYNYTLGTGSTTDYSYLYQITSIENDIESVFTGENYTSGVIDIEGNVYVTQQLGLKLMVLLELKRLL